MKAQTLATYQPDPLARLLAVAGPKEFKTATLVAHALGCGIGQTARQPIVSHPKYLHVLCFDKSTLSGLGEFLTGPCALPKLAWQEVRAWNFEADVDAAATSTTEYDARLFAAVCSTATDIGTKHPRGEVGLLLVSSLSVLAQAILRQMAGPTGENARQSGHMNQDKWGQFGKMLADLRGVVQSVPLHVVWEGHIIRVDIDSKALTHEGPRETLMVPGRQGTNWSMNVDQIVRVRRGPQLPGQARVYPTFFDTSPTGDFLLGGRGFTTRLVAHESDLTAMFGKLGLAIAGKSHTNGARVASAPKANPVLQGRVGARPLTQVAHATTTTRKVVVT